MFPWTFTIELICLATAIYYLRHRQEKEWKLFIYYLFFITIIEAAGWSCWFIFGKKNHWIYNIELPVTTLFISWFLQQEFLKFRVYKGWVIAGFSLFAGSYIFESFQTKLIDYNVNTATLRAILVLLGCCFYYMLILRDRSYINLFKSPSFWIVAGVFFFYFTSTTTNLFLTQLTTIFLAKGVPLRHILYTFFNFILYGCWYYAFKCKYLQDK